MKLLAASIVSKFNFKVRLCCKEGKQDVSRDFKKLEKCNGHAQQPMLFFFSVRIKSNGF